MRIPSHGENCRVRSVHNEWVARQRHVLPFPAPFIDPGYLSDRDLSLHVRHLCPADDELGWVAAYYFDMMVAGERAGSIDLRLGDTHHLRMYGGQIGYDVRPEHRGHHYAARSVRLLLPLAWRHGMDELWITCNPDNYASARSCELAGGRYIETVDVPPDTDLYREGDRQKRRYLFATGPEDLIP